jgi:hypothetical protein
MAGFGELQKILAQQDYPELYHAAKAKGTCILCGDRALIFRDPSSQLEYRVSGLCQKCQDKHFSGGTAVP